MKLDLMLLCEFCKKFNFWLSHYFNY